MRQGMTKLDEAKSFLEEALREFERGVKDNNMTLVRDAGEKAWGAVVQATNDLFERRGLPIPITHRERREYLEKLEEVDPTVREKGLTDRFMARDHVLHERCFYEGYCNVDELRREFEKVKRYISDIEKL